MIDLVYKIVTTIINKENNGYVTPTEFNLLGYKAQMEIFDEYFDNENRDKNRENRGLTNRGYGNLDFNERQKITKFAARQIIDKSGLFFILPSDIYLIEDKGVSSLTGKVIEESERNNLRYLLNSDAAPTLTFPVYEQINNELSVYPNTITSIELRYLRKPRVPNWTYTIVSGKELFDPSNGSYQDFELHISEFGNLVLRILSYFSINLREDEVMKIAEELKNQQKANENN